ncbi:glycosyltransferase [Flavihumibacter sp. R14]|nr:glycosyltransferase [Flavihumibacter soli]
MQFQQSMKPLVSVIIPCYNHQSYVVQALQSAFDQDYSNFEVIIRDDFSTDDSAEKIKEFLSSLQNVKNIPYVVDFGIENIGMVRSVNKLISLAKGEIIFSCSSDDVLKPFRLSYVVAKSNRYKEIDLFLSDAEVIDSNGKLLKESFYNFNVASFGSDASSVDDEDYVFSNRNYRFAAGINFGGFGMAIRKRILKDFEYQIPEHLPYEDYLLSFLGIVQGGVMYTSKKLLQYRRTGNNISSIQKYQNEDEIVAQEAKFLRWTNLVEYEKINFLKTKGIAKPLSSKRNLMILLLKQNVVMNKMIISLAEKRSRFKLAVELLLLIIEGPKRKVCLNFFVKNLRTSALMSLVKDKFEKRETWASS